MNTPWFRAALAFALALAGCSGLASAQTLSLNGTPALLQTITINVQGPPNAVYMLGASETAGPTDFAPLGSFALGLPIYLIVGPPGDFPFNASLGPTGTASLSFQIPFQFWLVGQTWFLQGVYTDSAAPFGWSKTNGINFTIADPYLAPTITGMTPNAGPASGGTPVSITGTHFVAGSTTVLLGGASLQNLNVASPTLITGQTPPGLPGAAAALQVTTATGGTALLQGAFAYLPVPPSFTSITPDHVQSAGGTPITITGAGLGPGTSVFINGLFVIPLSQTGTQFVGLAPAASQPGYATVVAASAAGFTQLSNVFRYSIALNTGDGSSGVFAPVADTSLDTTNNGGVFNFTEVTIPAGVTVTAFGPNPLEIRCRGPVVIAGALRGDGIAATGQSGGGGGPGGGAGGAGGNPSAPSDAGAGPGGGAPQPSTNAQGYGGSYGTAATYGQAPTYGNALIQPLLGGSGGGGGGSQSYGSGTWFNGGGGGGGGGAISILASGNITIAELTCRGAGGFLYISPVYNWTCGGSGSGGAIRLASESTVTVTGISSVAGGISNGSNNPTQYPGYTYGGNGRWFLQNWLGQTWSGTTALLPLGSY